MTSSSDCDEAPTKAAAFVDRLADAREVLARRSGIPRQRGAWRGQFGDDQQVGVLAWDLHAGRNSSSPWNIMPRTPDVERMERSWSSVAVKRTAKPSRELR